MNSVLQSSNHKKRYMVLKSRLKLYKLPVIIISAFNAVFSIGLQPFLEQNTISIINSLLALSCGIIGSVELYLQITKNMESSLISSKDFYELSIDVFKFLSLKEENRTVTANVFIDEIYNRYIKLIQSSTLLKKRTNDELTGECVLTLNGFVLSPSLQSLASTETSSDTSDGV
jgi:nitrogen fixation/metabolism regulation signal transduction histidine kinase